MSSYIKNQYTTIKILCKDIILDKIKMEMENYYEFVNESNKYDISMYIFTNKEKYDKLSKKIINNSTYKGMQCFKEREAIIIVNTNQNEIFVFYKELNNNTIQFIGEIIVSVFGIELEKRNCFFLHSSCVERHGEAVAIIGDRNSGKTTILNALLQEKFNFICNSHLGVVNKENSVEVLGTPTRMGMRISTLEKIIKPEIRQQIIEVTEFKKRFGQINENNLKEYYNKKFNIKMNEIKDIYGVKLVNKAKLKFVIIPMYIEQMTDISIKEMQKEDKIDILIKNRRTGTYDTMKFLNTEKFSHILTNIPRNLLNIDMFKIYYNEKNIKNVIKFIKFKMD